MHSRSGIRRRHFAAAPLCAGVGLLLAGCITPAYGPPAATYASGAMPPPGIVLPPGETLPPGAIVLPESAGVFQPGIQYGPPQQPPTPPLLVPVMDRDVVWDQVVDAVDDYFKIRQERRIKLEGDLLTEGSLETFPRGGSTILEPWNRDSTPGYEKLESTLQSIRRQAIVRVAPAEDGFWVDVVVMKELEDVARPESGSISVSNLRNDSSTPRYVNPVTGARQTVGWIPLGRDASLEQTILANIQCRFAASGGIVAY